MTGMLAAVATLAALLVQAQPAQVPFRSTVRLIVQPVTVKDKNGKPVEGLTARDFVISEDGRPQEIAFVEFQHLEAGTVSNPNLPAATAAPVAREGESVSVPGDRRYRSRRLLILYFDLYRMPPNDQFRAFANADTYITTHITPVDLVAVMVFEGRGVRLKQDFTDDREALRGVVRELMNDADESASGLSANWDPGSAFGEDDGAFNLFTTDRQLAALQTAVTDLRPLPQIKTLIYFGSGLRMQGADNLAQLRATVNAAIRANVTLNPIDTRGLVATAPLGDAARPSPGGVGMFSGALAFASTTRFQQTQDVLYALAKDTGGKALLDNNDLSLGILQAAQAVTGYYIVGYYTSNTAADGRFRRVKVSLRNAMSADLSYRSGYYGDKVFGRFTKEDKERQLLDALRLEDPITEIPMAMEVNYFQLNEAEYFLPVSVRIPAGLTEIDVIGEIKDEHGVTHRNVRDRITIPPTDKPIQYETGFTVLPGDYSIKLLVRDAVTGRIGTFQRAFTIPNLERERVRLPISSVVLTNQRVARADALFTVAQEISSDTANPLVYDGQKLIPSVTRSFIASLPLIVFLEAYEHDGAAVHQTVAYVTLVRDNVRVLETEPVAVSGNSSRKSRSVPIRLTIPLDRLSAGPYECQVTVLDPDGARAAFWRAPIVVRH